MTKDLLKVQQACTSEFYTFYRLFHSIFEASLKSRLESEPDFQEIVKRQIFSARKL